LFSVVRICQIEDVDERKDWFWLQISDLKKQSSSSKVECNLPVFGIILKSCKKSCRLSSIYQEISRFVGSVDLYEKPFSIFEKFGMCLETSKPHP
jgi:hypothetical protein